MQERKSFLKGSDIQNLDAERRVTWWLSVRRTSAMDSDPQWSSSWRLPRYVNNLLHIRCNCPRSFNTSWVSCELGWLACACRHSDHEIQWRHGFYFPRRFMFARTSCKRELNYEHLSWVTRSFSPAISSLSSCHVIIQNLNVISIVWYRHNPTSIVLTTHILLLLSLLIVGWAYAGTWDLSLVTYSRLPVLGLQGLAHALGIKKLGRLLASLTTYL